MQSSSFHCIIVSLSDRLNQISHTQTPNTRKPVIQMAFVWNWFNFRIFLQMHPEQFGHRMRCEKTFAQLLLKSWILRTVLSPYKTFINLYIFSIILWYRPISNILRQTTGNERKKHFTIVWRKLYEISCDTATLKFSQQHNLKFNVVK